MMIKPTILLILVSLSLSAQDSFWGLPKKEAYLKMTADYVSSVLGPKSEKCSHCRVFSSQEVQEKINNTPDDKVKLTRLQKNRAAQCLIALCPSLLEGQSFGELLEKRSQSKNRIRLFQNSPLGMKIASLKEMRNKVDEDGFEKTRQNFLEKIQSDEDSNELQKTIAISMSTFSGKDYYDRDRLTEINRQIESSKLEDKKNRRNLTLEKETLEASISQGIAFDSEIYREFFKNQKPKMGFVLSLKPKEREEYYAELLPDWSPDLGELNDIPKAFVRKYRNKSKEKLRQLIELLIKKNQDPSSHINLENTLKLIDLESKEISLDNFRQVFLNIETIGYMQKHSLKSEVDLSSKSNRNDFKKKMIQFLQQVNGKNWSEQVVPDKCRIMSLMHKLEASPTRSEINNFAQKVYPEELKKIIQFANSNYSSETTKHLTEFLRNGVKIVYPQSYEDILEQENKFFPSGKDLMAKVSYFMEKTSNRKSVESCDQTEFPIHVTDKIDTRPFNIIEVSSISVLTGESGRDILRHELGHAIYRYFEKNNKLSFESKRSHKKMAKCTRKAHNFGFFHSHQDQFESEDFADMLSAVSDKNSDQNAFCNMAGNGIYNSNINSVFHSRSAHSPPLFRLIFTKMLSGKKIPQTCQAIYEESIGSPIEIESCYPKAQ